MIKLSGLWLNKMPSGELYMAGSLGNSRVIVFKNTFKKPGSKEPDYTLYLDEQKKKEQLTLEEDQLKPEEEQGKTGAADEPGMSF